MPKINPHEEVSRPPQYAQHWTGFVCPMSTYIAWHWGLEFKECPLDIMQRDMKECGSCHLRGTDAPIKPKKRPRRRKKANQED